MRSRQPLYGIVLGSLPILLGACGGQVRSSRCLQSPMHATISQSTVILSPQYACVPAGTKILCANGGTLHFDVPAYQDEVLEDVSVRIVVAIAPHPENTTCGPERMRIIVTSAFVDAEGRLWQSTRYVSVYELWSHIADNGILYANSDEPVGAICRPEVSGRTVTSRKLISKLDCLFDGRDSRLISIIQRECDGDYPFRTLYELREKYFGVCFDLLEERIHLNERELSSRLVLMMQFSVDPEMIATLGNKSRLIASKRRCLMMENPVRGYGLRLNVDPRLGSSPQEAAVESWREALGGLGRSSAEIAELLAPNPFIRLARKDVAL